jgi:hypothetical protein
MGKMTNRRLKILKKLDHNVKDEYIFEFCKAHGFKKEVALTIISFLSNTIDDTCFEMDITPQTLDYRIKKFLESE